jgi:hypothetical protein
MADPIFEGVKTIGSLSGLISIAILVFDRLVKNRPHMWVSIDRFGAGDGHAQLTVYNRSSAPIWIRRIKIRPALMRVARDSSIHGIAGSVLDDPYQVMLPPEQPRDFPLLAKRGEAPSQKRCWIWVFWRSTRYPGLPQVPAVLPVTYAELRDMELAHGGSD